MRTALITGACGFVGRNLVYKLLESKYEIYAIDCAEASCFKDAPAVHYVKSNLSDINAIDIPKNTCDVLYHLAWAGVRPEARSDINVQKHNIDLCINAVELAKRLGIKRVVFIGSTMEYCYNEEPICESSRPTPSNCYGSTKIATRYICSQLCRDYGIDFEYAVITSIYGPGREDNNVIYYCINKLLNGEIPELSECIQHWDFVHISDAVNALKLIGERGVPYSFYAIGTGENRRLRECIDIISNLIDKNIPIKFGAVPYKNGLIANSAVNTKKLTEDTGYSPAYQFEIGISEVIDFYKQNK